MSTITVPNVAGAAFEERVAPRAGILRQAFSAIIEARCREAGRRVAHCVAGMSAERLADLGFSDADIASIRAGEPEHAAGRPGWRNAWRRIGSGVRACLAAIAERRSSRRAERELESLDDRMLEDIGIHRTEIVRVVRYGRLT